jgi:hypothetical protein
MYATIHGRTIPSQPVYGPTGVSISHGYYQHPKVNQQLTFFSTIDILDLSHLTNDPILHAPFWPPILAKLPSNIPKFDGRPREDPNNHVMRFHIWCSLPRHSFSNFNSLAMYFLTHFQLSIRYETGTKILTSLKKSTSTHIFVHTHEWRKQ